MSRAHKVLNTWFKNRETQQNFATGKSQIPTPAERKAQLEKQQDKKIKVDEAIDKEHPIYKEYQGLKKHDIKTLRGIIKGQHRIVDTSEFRTKEHAISHILHNKHGAKRMAAVFGESAQIDELKASTLQSYANKAHQQSMDYSYDAEHQYKDKEAQKQSRFMAQKRAGGVERAQTKLDKMEEDTEFNEEVKHYLVGMLGQNLTGHTSSPHFKSKEDAQAYQKKYKHVHAIKSAKIVAGVSDKHGWITPVHEANKSKPVPMSHTVYDAHDREERQMRNMVSGREGGVQKDTYKHAKSVGVKEDMDITKTFFSLIEGWETEKKKRHLQDALSRHTEKALAANKAGDHDAVRVHQSYMNKIKGQMTKLSRNESIDDIWDTSDLQILDEAWNVNKRNTQRGVKVGHKVRSYDFPGMHDDHYIEGHVVGETPSSYHIKVNKVVRSGKEIPTPAHMHHVEAPKGRSIWTDAYAVHKLKEQTETNEQAVAPVEKNYYKGIRLHFAKGNRGGKSSSNKGGAADGGNGGGGGDA